MVVACKPVLTFGLGRVEVRTASTRRPAVSGSPRRSSCSAEESSMFYGGQMMRTLLCWLLLACCFVVCGGRVLGQSGRRSAASKQEGQPEAVQEADDVVRVRTEEVLLPVSVRDWSGASINGLSRDDFIVYDEGVRQQISSFNRQRVAANIVLLLDASGSIFQQMRFIRQAAKGFIEGLLPEDKICVMQFADKVELLQDWTAASQQQSLEKALDWRYHPGESTTFYDGLYLAAEDQLSKIEGRRIVILLTDGIDTAERRKAGFKDALNAIERAEASVYVVSLTGMLREMILRRTGESSGQNLLRGYDPHVVGRYLRLIDESEKQLTSLATQTGGRIFLPLKDEDLSAAYRAIAEELRTQYIITYKPNPKVAGGQWRRVRVLVLPGGYEIGTREGYIVRGQ
jgi:Ca-activated chloride channel family protein